jgi:gentisate 1,2-dioxygenase
MTSGKSELEQFSRHVRAVNVTPLWERAESAMRPGTDCVPCLWRYSELRPKLLESARLISEEQAERRVLVLENPKLPGTTFITNTLYAGMQIILPGETAASHRHTPSALRLVIEGEGGFTIVDGQRTELRRGDFIVTPAWSWHSHGNDGTGPVVWVDGLDTPFTRFFGATFRENQIGAGNAQPAADASLAAYGSNLLPMDAPPETTASPLLRYPYKRTREVLLRQRHFEQPHPAHGLKMHYANPLTGKHPFPTIAAFMQLLPDGFQGKQYRSTDGSVYAVIEGAGSVVGDSFNFDFAPGDVFVIPSWTRFRLNAGSDAILFSFSDRAAQETLGFWREETG